MIIELCSQGLTVSSGGSWLSGCGVSLKPCALHPSRNNMILIRVPVRIELLLAIVRAPLLMLLLRKESKMFRSLVRQGSDFGTAVTCSRSIAMLNLSRGPLLPPSPPAPAPDDLRLGGGTRRHRCRHRLRGKRVVQRGEYHDFQVYASVISVKQEKCQNRTSGGFESQIIFFIRCAPLTVSANSQPVVAGFSCPNLAIVGKI